MSVDYTLEIHNKNNDLKPSGVHGHLQSDFSLEKNELSGILVGEGYTVYSFINDDEYRESVFGGQYYDLLVSFQVDKLNDYIGTNNMMKAVFSLMSFFEEDMMFLYNGEVIIFKRLSGELTINSNTDFWDVYKVSIPEITYKKENFKIL